MQSSAEEYLVYAVTERSDIGPLPAHMAYN